MTPFTTEKYIERSRKALADSRLQGALSSVQSRLGPATQRMYGRQPEGPGIRQQAHAIRRRAIDNLDLLLEELADRVTENGGQVFLPGTGPRRLPTAWMWQKSTGSGPWSRANPW